MVSSPAICFVFSAPEHPGKPGQLTGYHSGEVIAPVLRHLRVVHIEYAFGKVYDRNGRIETSVSDIPRFAGPTRALVHNGLEDFPQLNVTARRVEPLLEQLQVSVSSNMTTRHMA